MLEIFLKRYNRYRKEKFFQSPLFHTQQQYAFIGVGIHSLTNFFPLLRFFGIRLKYICTQGSDWSKQLSPLFPGCIFTHDLQDILQDPTIAGVFICADPASHYQLSAALLKAGKPVFIEKPPCTSLSELQSLLPIGQEQIYKIGLQRRYWPGNQHIVKKCRQATSYIYQFQTGPYPQGDPFTELFIHPLDYCHFLFGTYQLNSFSNHKDDTGLTIQMHVTHTGNNTGNISGLIQLSTHHSWNPAFENLSVTGKTGSLNIQYPGSVTERPAPRRILNIPAERLLQQPAIIKEYYSGGPSIIPALELNTLVTQGFYHEMETFISLVENGAKTGVPSNDLDTLQQTYATIEQLKAG